MGKYTKLVSIPAGINVGLNGTRNSFMIPLLGNPRSNYSQDCSPITNPALKARMKTASVGPFKATGLDKAVASLKAIMADVASEQPEVHALLGSAGMLCCRNVRGSSSAISNHSWGTAIDLTIDGVLDPWKDGKVQFGLTLIAPIFNRHKWFWGAGFSREDGMHFEVSAELLSEWEGAPKHTLGDSELAVGDRGPMVLELQKILNGLGEKLVEDGIFGTGTRAAVVAFQAAAGLKADGVVGPKTWTKLKP